MPRKLLLMAGLFLASAWCQAATEKAPSQLPAVTELFTERVRVLYLARGASHQHYYALNFLERHTNLRFIYQRDSDPENPGNDDSAAITDGILWDLSSFPAKLKERIERLEGYLRRKQFDFIVLEARKFPSEIEKLLVDYVASGGKLVWLGGSAVEEGILATLSPFTPSPAAAGRRQTQTVEVLEPEFSILANLPVAELFGQINGSPVHFKKGVQPLVRSLPSQNGLLGLMRIGQGYVLACNFSPMVPCRHAFAEPESFNSDFLWACFWEQLGQAWKRGVPSPRISLVPPAETVTAGQNFQVEIRMLDRVAFPLRLTLTVEDASGEAVASIPLTLQSETGKIRITVSLPEWLPTGSYLLKVAPAGSGQKWSAYGLVRVKGSLTCELTSDRYGTAAGGEISFRATVRCQQGQVLKARWMVVNPFGRLVAYQVQPAALFPETENTLTFTWKMQDYGVEGWAFRTILQLQDSQGKIRSQRALWFWRYQPWTMREKFLFSNYWAGMSHVPSSLMPLFVRYHRQVGYNGGHSWQEPYYSRFNMRAWYQWPATGMESFTGNFQTPDFSHLKKRAEETFSRTHHTAAYVIQDFGEETGFYYHWSNNPFGRTWLQDKDIPEGAHRLFQLYLREKYGRIDRLNTEWETKYRDFSEVKLRTENGYPAGWLFGKPPAKVPDNIAPLLDTHGFFFWYTRQVAETLTSRLKELNPVSDWSMSFSLTFNLFSPVPMTMVHPVYHASVLAPWHDKALARSKNGSTPFFSFHWGFDEDERVWGQFWNHSLAALATFMSNWGSQFNCDLTHSRSTLLLKRLLARVRPREQFFLSCYPVADFDVGIYHPDLDWQTVHSRPNFYLRASGSQATTMGQLGFKPVGTGWLGGPEFQVYNALNSSGYVARFITEEEIPRCRAIVVPYVETMPETAAARLRDFVAAGGLLVTMPVLATHNGYGRPYPVCPGGGLNEVIGVTLEPAIIGQRSLVTLGTNPVIPWHFLQRAGSEPCYLWTFGHQRVPQMSPDTQVVVKLYDGEPAITVHSFGKGKAIHLNMFTFEPFDPYEFSSFQAESLRELFDNLLQWHGLKPFLTVEWPLLYGQAVDHWTLYQYRLKDSPVRVLALFSDRTSPAITAQVVLREPVEEVIDVLANQRLPLRRRSGGLTTEETEPFAFTKSNRATLPAGYFFPVSLSPGQVAFFALVPFKMVPVQAALRKSQLIAGRDYLELTITVPEEKGKPASDSRPVHLDIFGPRGQPLPEMSRRLNVKGKQTLFLPIPLTAPGGRWRLNITDVLSGYQKRLFPLIVAADNLPEPPDIFSASTQPKRIEISDREFCLLLENLRKIYLTGGTGDKVSLSYYCFESDISRHRIAQLLLETDWLKKVDALKKYLASGQTVILLGEDLGFDPESGLSLETLTEENSDPSVDSAAGGKLPALPSASIIPAIEKLTETRDLMARLQKERRLVLPVGKGKILLDLASFDQAGQENSLFHLSHYRWLQSLPVEFRQE